MRYLPILFAILLAAPAWGQSQWPAGKVLYSNSDTVEGERDIHRNYAFGSLPTCNTAAKGTTAYVNDASAAGQCDSGGTAWTLCGCDGTSWSALGGGGHAESHTNASHSGAVDLVTGDSINLISSPVTIFGMGDDDIIVGTGLNSFTVKSMNTCTAGTQADRWNGTAFVCDTLSGTELANSSDLLAALDDETGTGLAVFNTDPTLAGLVTTENFSISGEFISGTTARAQLANSATPSIAGQKHWMSRVQGNTYTGFAGGSKGMEITVLTQGGNNVSYDCTSSDLICGTTDFVAVTGSISSWVGIDATQWRLTSFVQGDKFAGRNPLGPHMESTDFDVTSTFAAIDIGTSVDKIRFQFNSPNILEVSQFSIWDFGVITVDGSGAFRIEVQTLGPATVPIFNTITPPDQKNAWWSAEPSGASTEFNLDEALDGMNVCFRNNLAGKEMLLDPVDIETIDFPGLGVLPGGNKITNVTSQGAGDYVCFVSFEDGKWLVTDFLGTWTDGGA